MGPTPTFAHQDALGSVVALTDGTGAILRSTGYEAFGSLRGSRGVAAAWGFTGRPTDPESGLVFLRHRYYDSQAGRFLTEDPLGTRGGVNLYAYVRNNPFNLIDPFGWEPGSSIPFGRFGDYTMVPGPFGPRFIDQRGTLVSWPGYQNSLSDAVEPALQVVNAYVFSNPAGSLRLAGRTLSEMGYPGFGNVLGTFGRMLEPGGTGHIVGLATGGTIGAAAGRYFGSAIGSGGGPIGGVGGAIIGGTFFGWVGSWFDSPNEGAAE